MTRTQIENIAMRTPIEWYNNGMQARFDTNILLGDYTIIEMRNESFANEEMVARWALIDKLKKQL